MNPKNKIFLSPAGGILATICFFLPWIKVDCFPQAASGADIGGIVWLVLISSLVIVGSFFFYRNLHRIEQSKKLITISSWSAFAILIIRYISFASSDYGKIGFTLQYGVFGVIIGFIGALVGVNYIKSEDAINEFPDPYIKEAITIKEQEKSHPTSSAQNNIVSKPEIKPDEKTLTFQRMTNTINSFDLAGKLKKQKKIIIITVISILILLIAYNVFFVTSPITDGRKAGELYNEYQNNQFRDQLKSYQDFLNNYDSYKFILKSQANDKMNEATDKYSAKTTELFAKMNDTYSKLRSRYADNPQKLNSFDNAYNITLSSNNNSELQSQVANLYHQIQNKISSIISPEPDTTAIKNDLLGKSYVKGKITWKFGFLSDILNTTIINKITSNSYCEYNIAFTLYDTNSGDTFKAKMIVSYNYNGDNWVLASSTMTNLEDITKRKKY